MAMSLSCSCHVACHPLCFLLAAILISPTPLSGFLWTCPSQSMQTTHLTRWLPLISLLVYDYLFLSTCILTTPLVIACSPSPPNLEFKHLQLPPLPPSFCLLRSFTHTCFTHFLLPSPCLTDFVLAFSPVILPK